MKKRATTRNVSRRRGSRAGRTLRSVKPGGRRKTPTRATTRRKSSSRTSRSAEVTTDHDEIREWVESHGGHPSIVKRTQRGANGGGVLRIDFPGFSGEESLAETSWDEWFRVFDERKLAFLYQNQKASRFNKLVSRSRARSGSRSTAKT